MSNDVDQGLEGQLRDACAELDRQLRAGLPSRAEAFFEENPALAAQPEAAVELIYTEFVSREEIGQAPALEEYLRRFPQWRDPLLEQFQIHALLSTMGGADSQPEQVHEQLPVALPEENSDRLIGEYELLEETARGAMGVVYKARHRPLKRMVALKMILAGSHAGKAERLRFRTEAEAVARLQHPNIVQIYEVGEIGGHPFLALEYVAGGSLAQVLTAALPPPRVAAELIETLARAVHYAHEHGVIHRDLKPSNVLLQNTDCRLQIERLDNHSYNQSAIRNLQSAIPKITDFGLAKVLDRGGGQCESEAICGTPGYMAPEQALGLTTAIGPGVDVYALGAILYELLTGRPPFRAETLWKTLGQVVSRDPMPPNRLQPGVPRDLATICTKCLEKEPRRRYHSAMALAEDLRRLLTGEPIQACPVTKRQRIWKWAKRRPAVAALLVLLGLTTVTALCGGFGYHARLRAAAAEVAHQHNQAQSAAQEASHQRSVAQTAAADAERQKSETDRQTALIRQQSDYTRRLSFTMQLAQIEEIWKSDPARALHLLEDGERCPRDLRDFAWGLYHHLCKQDRLIAGGHRRGISCMAFAADGRTFATAGTDDATVKLWDQTCGSVRATLQTRHGRIITLAFSPDGCLLATAGADSTVRLWLTATGQKLMTLRGHTGSVVCVAFARNGKTLASGSSDRTARQWDVTTGKELLNLQGHAGTVRSVAFMPDGEMLVTGGEDKTVRFWDLLTLAVDKERNSLKLDEQGPITCMALSPDGKKLAVAGARRAAIDLFDMDTLSLKTSFRGHVDRVHAVGFSPDGRLLASGSEDRTVRLWEVDSGTQYVALQGHSGAVRTVAFNANNQTLASAGEDNNVWLWAVGVRAETKKTNHDLTQSWAGRIMTMAYSPDGRTLATGDNDGLLKLWETPSQKQLAVLPAHAGPIWSLAFTKDGRILATCGEEGKVKLWDVQARRKIVTLAGHKRRVRCVAFSPDGKTLASAGEEGQVKLWDVAVRREQAALPNQGQEVFSLGFSPSGTTLAMGGQDGKVRLWNVKSQKEQAILTKHQKAVLFTLFSPDGQTLVTGGQDNTVHLWDAGTHALRATLLLNVGYVFSAAFTSDSKSLATGAGSRAGSHLPGEVKIWDATTGHCHATLPGQTGPVTFAPNGKTLATVRTNTSVKAWQASLD